MGYLEKYGLLWYAGETFYRGSKNSAGFNVLGPYCPNKDCRGELKQSKVKKIGETNFYCPLCDRKYNIPIISIAVAKENVRNEFYALFRRGKSIEIIKLDKKQTQEERIELEDNKWATIRAQRDKKSKEETIHIFIGDKKSGVEKAHLIISLNTGEIRIDKNDGDPGKHIKKIEVSQKDKKRIHKAEFES